MTIVTWLEIVEVLFYNFRNLLVYAHAVILPRENSGGQNQILYTSLMFHSYKSRVQHMYYSDIGPVFISVA